jgi:hypothetical protein
MDTTGHKQKPPVSEHKVNIAIRGIESDTSVLEERVMASIAQFHPAENKSGVFLRRALKEHLIQVHRLFTTLSPYIRRGYDSAVNILPRIKRLEIAIVNLAFNAPDESDIREFYKTELHKDFTRGSVRYTPRQMSEPLTFDENEKENDDI